MRVNGAIKSLLAGMSTLDEKRIPPGYAKDQVNMRSHKSTGLTRRPPLEFIAELTDYEPDQDIVRVATFDNEEYFVILRPRYVGTANDVVIVIDTAGNVQTVDVTREEYLSTITSEQDVTTENIGDLLLIANKNTQCSLRYQKLWQATKTSMFNVVAAPSSSGGYNIVIYGNNGFNANGYPVQVSSTVAIPANSSVIAIAQLIETAAATIFTHATVTRVGQTIVVEPDSPLVNPNGTTDYIQVAVEHDAGDGLVIPINGFVTDIVHVPPYAPIDTTLEVRDGDTKYYIRASAPQVTTPNTIDFTITTDRWLHRQGVVTNIGYFTGYLNANSPIDPLTTPVKGSLDANTTGYTVHYIGQVDNWLGNDLTSDVHDDDGNWFDIGINQTFSDPVSHVLVTEAETGRVIIDRNIDIQSVVSDYNTPGFDWWLIRVPWNSTEPALVRYETYNVSIETPGDALGYIDVQWTESANPELYHNISEGSMPHVLLKDGTDFKFGPLSVSGISWDSRKVGDEDTNPIPAFIDKTISDMIVYQGRLCILAGDKVCISEAGNLFNFWRTTVTQVLVSDPTSLTSSAAIGNKLDYFVPHNKDLLIFSRSGQYKISGDIPITPQTVSMSRVADYNYTNVTPINIGSSVYYAFSYGSSYGVSEYKTDTYKEGVDVSNPITDHVATLMQTCKQIVGSGNLAQLYVRGDYDTDFWVCEMIPTPDGVVFSWSRWYLPVNMKLGYLYVKDEILYVVAQESNGNATLLKCNLSLDTGASTIFLDKKLSVESITTTLPTVYSDNSSTILVQGTGCPHPGDTVSYTIVGPNLVLDEDMGGGTVIMGVPNLSVYQLPRLRIRDDSGMIQTEARLSLLRYAVSIANTVSMDAAITSDYYADVFYQYDAFASGDLDALTDGLDYNNEAEFHIPCNQKADQHNLALGSISYHNCTITNVEWFGRYSNRGRRF